jgi:hypothetical protein
MSERASQARSAEEPNERCSERLREEQVIQ